jgi:hypothetical protein
MSDPSVSCPVHELSYCGICHPPAATYRRGQIAVDAPAGSYVEIHPGTEVYHQPDCYMVTGEWEGADNAKLGKRIVRSPDEIRERGLRPAQCCEPPTIR